MLLRFTFENFKSFRDSATIDLTAAKISEYRFHLRKIGNMTALPVAAIYGANASGKSNVIEAFDFMHHYVVNSLKFGDDDDEKSEFAPVKPFMFDAESGSRESTFEIYFTVGSRIYDYGFSVCKKRILREWLYTRAKTSREDFDLIFKRDGELDLSGIPQSHRASLKNAMSERTLLVSVGAILNIFALKTVRTWFNHNNVLNFGDPYSNLRMSRMLPKGFAEDETLRDNIVQYFSSFDDSIVKLSAEEENGLGRSESIFVDSFHKHIDDDKVTSIPLEEESAGTLKMLAMYSPFKYVLRHGNVIFIDELNARLHPLLVRSIILTFADPETNPNGAQLVFTTHDPWLLSGDILRRDEIWFTEKVNGISSLYSLADFEDNGKKIRKDESLEKNYLLGKYGAVPQLKIMDLLNIKDGIGDGQKQ